MTYAPDPIAETAKDLFDRLEAKLECIETKLDQLAGHEPKLPQLPQLPATIDLDYLKAAVSRGADDDRDFVEAAWDWIDAAATILAALRVPKAEGLPR